MEVGTIVKLKISVLDNPTGTQGLVYERYKIGKYNGVSVIFPNGNYDGFSEAEQRIFLEKIGFNGRASDYKFTNVMRLSQDFNNGKFDHFFKQN